MTVPGPLAAYARAIAARLPAPDRDHVTAELLDHLITDYERHVYSGIAPADAVAAVLVRFGPKDQVAAEYQREERRHRRHRLAASAATSTGILGAIWTALLVLAPPASRWPLRPQPSGVAATGLVMLAAALNQAAIASLVLATASAGTLTAWRAIAAGQAWMAIALPCAAAISAVALARLNTDVT